MKPKALWKMAVDLAMTVLLFCLMAYLLVGETAHEWLGVAMFGLFLLHHGLNGHWHHNLAKGRYTPLRVFQTVVDVLILLAMAGLMVSGVILSRVVFSFRPISGGMGFARTLHMLASYWGFLFISLHLGLHWGVVMGVMRKATNKKAPSAARTWLLRAAAALLAGFGAYAFFKHNIASYGAVLSGVSGHDGALGGNCLFFGQAAGALWQTPREEIGTGHTGRAGQLKCQKGF